MQKLSQQKRSQEVDRSYSRNIRVTAETQGKWKIELTFAAGLTCFDDSRRRAELPDE